MNDDREPSRPRAIVARGYDLIADAYLRRFLVSTLRDQWSAELIAALPRRAKVLDLGCGAGIPVSAQLTALGHAVTGVDCSQRQIELARSHVPTATFLRADMVSLELPPASFDAVGAFYCITHVPAAEQGLVIRRISEWLRPDGTFVGSFGSGGEFDWTGEWLGTEMFFGHNSESTTLALLRSSGLEVIQKQVVPRDNDEASFLWIVARKRA